MIEEQTKAVATALRVEKRLKEHMLFTNERKEMIKMIARAKQFESGSSAIQEAEATLMQKDFEEQK